MLVNNQCHALYLIGINWNFNFAMLLFSLVKVVVGPGESVWCPGLEMLNVTKPLKTGLFITAFIHLELDKQEL